MTLRIVIFREGRFWLAQGLEHDVGVQGENLTELVHHIGLALELEGAVLTTLPPAPEYFQRLWPLKAGLFQTEGLPAHVLLGLVA